MAWVMFGLLTGVLVHTLYPTTAKGGVIGAMITGLFGAVVGGLFGI